MPTSLENTATVEYLRDHAEELVNTVSGAGEPLFITVGDQPKAVLVDVEKYEEFEQLQRDLMLLKILNERSRQIDSGEVVSAKQVIEELRKRYATR